MITLGIIGVVAALTIPSLISKHQECVLRNRAKKAYSTLNNAYYKTLSDLEFSNTCFYNTNSGRLDSDCSIFKTALKNNLNIVKTCEENSLANGCISANYKGLDDLVKASNSNLSQEELQDKVDYISRNCSYSKSDINNVYNTWVLNDGLTIIFINNEHINYFAIDTNGMQGPNRWGYDMFIIIVEYTNMNKLNIFNKCISCCASHGMEKGGKYLEDWIK